MSKSKSTKAKKSTRKSTRVRGGKRMKGGKRGDNPVFEFFRDQAHRGIKNSRFYKFLGNPVVQGIGRLFGIKD